MHRPHVDTAPERAPDPQARGRVLLVSHVFPPLVAGGAVRMGQFARMLPERGWEVSVLTGRHGAGGVDRETADAIAKHARVVTAWSPASDIVRRGTPAPRRGYRAVIQRTVRTAAASVLFPDRQVLWVPSAIEAGRKLLSEVKHDVVLATHGPASNLIVGRALASMFKLPLVVDFRDLWSTLPMDVFPTRLHRRAAQALEGSVCRKASRMIAVAPGMTSELAATHGVDPDRALTITNGFDPADLARVHDARGTAPRPFRLMYLGSINVHYNLEPLWNALRSLADAGEITPETLRLDFVGNLATSDVKQLGLADFVDTTPFVPRDRVFDEFARADALLMVETAGYYARFSYAAKVFDYVLTGKPVIALVEAGGNTATLLERAGVGHIVDPNDTDGVRRALVEVMKLKGAKPRTIDPDAPPLRDFNRQLLVDRLASVLDEVVQTEPQGRW
jgi:glycosyltransferase involved in cell wall biosynthesis